MSTKLPLFMVHTMLCAGDYFYQVWHQYFQWCKSSRPDKKTSLKRGTLENRYGVTFFLAHTISCASDHLYQVWHQYLKRYKSRTDRPTNQPTNGPTDKLTSVTPI